MPSVQKIADGFGLQSQTVRLLFVILYPTKQIMASRHIVKQTDFFFLFGAPEFTIRDCDYSIILHPTLFNLCTKCIDVKYRGSCLACPLDTKSVTVYPGGCRVAMR